MDGYKEELGTKYAEYVVFVLWVYKISNSESSNSNTVLVQQLWRSFELDRQVLREKLDVPYQDNPLVQDKEGEFH